MNGFCHIDCKSCNVNFPSSTLQKPLRLTVLRIVGLSHCSPTRNYDFKWYYWVSLDVQVQVQ